VNVHGMLRVLNVRGMAAVNGKLRADSVVRRTFCLVDGQRWITCSFANLKKINKQIFFIDAMKKDDDGNPKPKRQTTAEMNEVCHQQELAKQIAEQNSQNAIAAVGLVEDSLRDKDIARLTRPNCQQENIPAFRPPASVTHHRKRPNLGRNNK
jgi:hypothetical protein